MEERRCESCMKMTQNPVCEHCGYPQTSRNGRHQLPVGSLLGGRYQLGKVLGQGGFGITYLAWDLQAEERVAVKEFYPSSAVNRDCSETSIVRVNTDQMLPHYESSRERFLREAKALSQFEDVQEIVDIRDFLEENNTAYIVMEYVQGMDLARYVQRRGGKLTVDETFRILKSVMEALARVHKEGLVHRDISPDNIILHPMGGAKLLDFGAVRRVEDAGVEKVLTKSTEAILKHGFAPIEQYQSRGSLGPWTDEYAMCATIYYCLTGRIIEDATTRMSEDLDPDWSSIEGLTKHQIAALTKGLSVRAKDRFASMDELNHALFSQPEKSNPPAQTQKAPQEEKPVREPKSRPEKPAKEPNPPKKKKTGRGKVTLAAILAFSAVALSALVWILRPEAPKAAIPQANQGESLRQPESDGSLPPDAAAIRSDETYTYQTADDQFPTNWSPCSAITEADQALLDSLSASLYAYDFNPDKTGFALVPEMAAAMPEDVTAQYAGQFGITAGETEKAWRILLREDLCWEDGTPITAQDFVDSAQRLLDPQAANTQATILIDNLPLFCAREYNLGDDIRYLENATYRNYQNWDVKKQGQYYYGPDGEQIFLAVNFPLTDWLTGNTLAEYVDSYGSQYFSMTHWKTLSSMADENGLVPMTDDTRNMFINLITGNPAWGETEEYLCYYFVCCFQGQVIPFSQVGILSDGERELVLILEEPRAGFELLQSLTHSWLVNTELYDSLITGQTPYSTYGTSPETTLSCGPYRLVEYTHLDRYVLERNERYFDLAEDTYQTTHCHVIYSEDTQKNDELFRLGQLDLYYPDQGLMEDYILSGNLMYSGNASVFGMVFNPDMELLEQAQRSAGSRVNKTILTVPEFRMAMSLGLDRTGFVRSASPLSTPVLGLYSDYSISDPDSGQVYRNSQAAKDVLAQIYGTDTGIDWNPQQARQLFEEAYAAALEQGLLNDDDTVEITVGLPSDSAFYTNGFAFLQDHYTKLVKGTALEGRLVLKSENIGNAFSNAIRSGQVQMLFGIGWTGDPINPYALANAYTDPVYQYDPVVDYSFQKLTIPLGGTEYTASVQQWSQALNGQPLQAEGLREEISCGPDDMSPEDRMAILAALEQAVLSNYNYIPMLDSSLAILHSHQISYPVDYSIYGVGFGGLKYLRYQYSDAQWEAFVAEQGGRIDYTR